MAPTLPELGLVCITHSEQCRYRTITRKRLLTLPAPEQAHVLRDLYLANLERFHAALAFCDRHDIRLYRVTSNLFPFSDEPLGEDLLRSLATDLSTIGRAAERFNIRIVIHPDQYVVLTSDSPAVVATSIRILARHALAFDLFGLPRSPWSAIILHGGKANRPDRLVETIRALPPSIRSRLVLENDEYAYSAAQILAICRRAAVPMVFDNHHHAIKENLSTYDDPSTAHYVAEAATTWPNPAWQLVHLSNGRASFLDPAHSDLIKRIPAAYHHLPWIEVEAKGKERAISRLRKHWTK